MKMRKYEPDGITKVNVEKYNKGCDIVGVSEILLAVGIAMFGIGRTMMGRAVGSTAQIGSKPLQVYDDLQKELDNQ